MDFANDSDYLIAHNAVFDQQWGLFDELWQPWLCTYEDFIWPRNPNPTSLVNTALNHGIGVTKAHRALSDCQLIAELFDRTEDLQGAFEKAIARSESPVVRVVASVSFEEKELAKNAGFRWIPEEKLWVKNLKEVDLIVESKDWGFAFEY